MKDKQKTKEQLLKELDKSHKRIVKLESLNREINNDTDTVNEIVDLYRKITESTTDYIYVLSLEGNFIYVNSSIEQLGYTPQDLINQNGFDFIHPDNVEFLSSLLNQYVEAGSI